MSESNQSDDTQPKQENVAKSDVGYKKPPKHTQFAKGRSGNPKGRPKQPDGVSVKELLSGEQKGKNGEVISKREALVIAVLNGAAAGNQRDFGRFISLMKKADMFRKEQPQGAGRIVFFDTPRPSPEKLRAWRIKNGFDPDTGLEVDKE